MKLSDIDLNTKPTTFKETNISNYSKFEWINAQLKDNYKILKIQIISFY